MKIRLALASLVLLGTTMTVTSAGAATPVTGCGLITHSLIKADGFDSSYGPVVTEYDYAHPSKNAANALGTTIDFGAKALVVACLDPDHLAAAWKVQGFSGKATNATDFMKNLVAASSGAMVKTKVGPVTDYLDYGNGKADGLGSVSTAKSLRLDAWVANGKYVILTFITPVSTKPSAALLNFINSTLALLK
jgi:hypothetical protein